MERKSQMDMAGAVGLTVFAAVLAFNQVVIKIANSGFGPVFGAGLRSALALGVLLLWCAWRGHRFAGLRQGWRAGLLLGGFFSAEFLLLFSALDMTSVSRASIAFYSMPVWLAGIAHFALPGETLSRRRLIGLGLAMAGVAWALADPESRAAGNPAGDLLAVGAAICWAGIALTVRLSALSEVRAEEQLLWQLAVSSVVLCAAAPMFGPLLREVTLPAGLALGYGVIVASVGYLFWLWVMTIYPASDIASFSFLSPVLAVVFGWLVFDEPIGVGFVGGMVLVSIGIVLINKRRKRPSPGPS